MSNIQTQIQTLLQQLNDIILDKPQTVKLALSCILAGGHLLLQDLPGMGKTTLAHALAHGLGLNFNRVQFTNDLLPADIIGMSIYNQTTQELEFRQGAIFSQLLLADEINRSSPKTQSALLEAMEERQISNHGKTYLLPEPFFVIATQNPSQQSGVYPLPESQLDRFLMCLSLGYPSVRAERELLEGRDRRAMIQSMPRLLDGQSVQHAQAKVKSMYFAPIVLDYIQALVAKTRNSHEYHGLSPRGALAIKNAAAAHAYISNYDAVAIDDVQAVFSAVADHRLGQRFVAFNEMPANHLTIAQSILSQVSTV